MKGKDGGFLVEAEFAHALEVAISVAAARATDLKLMGLYPPRYSPKVIKDVRGGKLNVGKR